MSLNQIVKAAYLGTKNLYVCMQCQVVRLIPDEVLNSPEAKTTEKLTDTPTYLEIVVQCPVCKEATRHLHLIESNMNGSVQQQAIAGITAGLTKELTQGLSRILLK